MASYIAPKALRADVRSGVYTGPTPGQCPGFVHANLAVLPAAWADDFERFVRANPKACPVLERTAPGSGLLSRLAEEADIRTDLPRYRIFRHGKFERECTDLRQIWQNDLTGFLNGCSFSFFCRLRGETFY